MLPEDTHQAVAAVRQVLRLGPAHRAAAMYLIRILTTSMVGSKCAGVVSLRYYHAIITLDPCVRHNTGTQEGHLIEYLLPICLSQNWKFWSWCVSCVDS